MSDLEPMMMTMPPVPMRTVEEQWQIAGYQCGAYATLDREGLVFVDGKGGRCAMRQEQWSAYQAKCLQGAPAISMLVVATEEEAELASATRLRPSHFARSFREIEECLIAHARCISDDERDEIVRQIAGKLLPLKEAVLRAEEIWAEDQGKRLRWRCKHCGSDLLWSEDRGAHCDGCDEFDTEDLQTLYTAGGAA